MTKQEKLQKAQTLLNNNNVLKGYILGIILDRLLDPENTNISASDRNDWVTLMKKYQKEQFQIYEEELQITDGEDNMLIISLSITPETQIHHIVKKISLPGIGYFFAWYY